MVGGAAAPPPPPLGARTIALKTWPRAWGPPYQLVVVDEHHHITGGVKFLLDLKPPLQLLSHAGLPLEVVLHSNDYR